MLHCCCHNDYFFNFHDCKVASVLEKKKKDTDDKEREVFVNNYFLIRSWTFSRTFSYFWQLFVQILRAFISKEINGTLDLVSFWNFLSWEVLLINSHFQAIIIDQFSCFPNLLLGSWLLHQRLEKICCCICFWILHGDLPKRPECQNTTTNLLPKSSMSNLDYSTPKITCLPIYSHHNLYIYLILYYRIEFYCIPVFEQVNRSLVTSFLGTTLTYLIILLQYTWTSNVTRNYALVWLCQHTYKNFGESQSPLEVYIYIDVYM